MCATIPLDRRFYGISELLLERWLGAALSDSQSTLLGRSTLPKPVRVQEQRTLLFIWEMFVAAMRLTELQGERPHVIRERAGLA